MKIYVGRSVRCGAFLILTTKNKQVMEYVPYIGTVRCGAFWKGKDILCLLSGFI